jgi:hypothetical protein
MMMYRRRAWEDPKWAGASQWSVWLPSRYLRGASEVSRVARHGL